MSVTAEWVEGDDPPCSVTIMGGSRRCPSWHEYVAAWHDPAVPEALRDAALRSGKTTGRDLAEGHFVVRDGTTVVKVLGLTARGAADLLAAIADRRQHYMEHL